MKPLAVNIFDRPHILGHFLGYDRLQDIHGDWIKRVWTSDRDTWHQAHRGSYKTTAVSVVGPIWYHLYKPEDRILLTRKTYTAACDTLDEIAGHYRGPRVAELYRKVWGIQDFKLQVDRRGRIVLPTKRRPTKEGSLDAAGIDTKVTGLHFERQINDDTVTIKDRVSKAAREATRMYHEEQINLRNPGGTIGFVGTPWHRQDAWHVKDGNDWKERPGTVKYPVGTLRIPGFTPEYLARLQSEMTSSMYSCNYLLRVIADKDREFPDAVYAEQGEWPERWEWLVAFEDPAYAGTHYTALTILGMSGERYYARGWVWRKDATDQEMGDEITELLNEHKVGTLYVESNADKGWCAKSMAAIWPAVIAVNESENKHIKIITHAKRNFRLLRWHPDTQPEYMVQILDYKEGEEPDDAPDSLASLIRQMGIGRKLSLADRF